jgi:hypothetical protein
MHDKIDEEANPFQLDTLMAFVIAVGEKLRSSPTIKQMGAEQLGWFSSLLIASWSNPVEPVATLPNNEQLLKMLAGFRFSHLTSELLRSAKLPVHREHIIREFFDQRWTFVRNQFVPLPGDPSLLHNPEFGDVYRDNFLAALEEVRSAQ